MSRFTSILGLVVLAVALSACSGASAVPATGNPAPSGSPSGDVVAVSARDIAFVQTAIQATAGSPFTVAFQNQDSAPHNVAIVDASGDTVFKGDIVTGKTVDYAVPALAAGTYTFLCEVHPSMKGTLTVR